MKNLAIIPARSGSKRLPHKNIRLVNGLPLLYYSLSELTKIDQIDKIVLATDSDEYVNSLIGLPYYKQWEYVKRDDNTSNDYSTQEQVVEYVLKETGYNPENIILVQPTCPLVDANDIVSGLAALDDNPALNSIITIEEINRFFTDNRNEMIVRPRTQDKVPKYAETGCFWIFRRNKFEIAKNRIIEPYAFLKVSKTSALDIDTEEDFDIIEALLEKKSRKGSYYVKRKPGLKNYHGREIDPDGNERNLDDLDHKLDFYKEEIEFINQLPGGKLLDLGSGYGSVLWHINSRFDKYGLDVDQGLKKYILRYTDNVHIGELRDSTYPKDFFDVIFCGHVIEHVVNPEEFISNVRKILRPHGNLVISTPNFNSPLVKRFKEKFRLLNDPTHISLFTDRSLENFLKDHGFNVDKMLYPFFETKYFTEENLLRLFDTSNVSPPFYGNVVTAYCRKK